MNQKNLNKKHIIELHNSVVNDEQVRELINFFGTIPNEAFRYKLEGLFYISSESEFPYQNFFDLDLVVIETKSGCHISCTNMMGCFSFGLTKKAAINNFIKAAIDSCEVRYQLRLPIIKELEETRNSYYSFPEKFGSYKRDEVIEKYTKRGWNIHYDGQYNTVLGKPDSHIVLPIPKTEEIDSLYITALESYLKKLIEAKAPASHFVINKEIEEKVTGFSIETFNSIKPILIQQGIGNRMANQILEELIPIQWIKAEKENYLLSRFNPSTVQFSENFPDAIKYCESLYREIEIDLKYQDIFVVDKKDIVNKYLLKGMNLLPQLDSY